MENYESRPTREEFIAAHSGRVITGVTNVTLAQELLGYYEKQWVSKERVVTLTNTLGAEVAKVKQAVYELGSHFPTLRKDFLNTLASPEHPVEELTPDEKEVLHLGRSEVRRENIKWQKIVKKSATRPELYLQLPSDYVFPTIPLSDIDKVVYVRGVINNALTSTPVPNVTRDSFITDIMATKRSHFYEFLLQKQEFSYVNTQKVRNLFFTTHVLKQIGMRDEQIFSWMTSEDPYDDRKHQIVSSILNSPRRSSQLLNTVVVVNNYQR